ncbi:hypothetical protein AXE65_02045 [Ventosimonas gracilis]|uniref:Uncharacterized protein n=1 Tax=Ventosimonas gracilis TaxID=1680762 RepID=A0A139SUJ4_9GAMM|nr:hypothetical protein [Ventosimonas gracilis]KXU38266.1 hypothetical protein AXE65_02045 [Ventosimonas gracilis]
MSTGIGVNRHQQSEMYADGLMLAAFKRLCCDGICQRLTDMDGPSVMRLGARFKIDSVCCDAEKVLQGAKRRFLPSEPQELPQKTPL